MAIEQDIDNAFNLPDASGLSEEFIRDHPDLMWLPMPIDYMAIVPAYMLWCIRHKEIDGNLVCDYTINALAEFGRAKDPANKGQNFKYLCSEQQSLVVQKFLHWCSDNLEFYDGDQLARCLNRWQKR